MDLKTAQRLLDYRKKAGLSQEELAEKIGVSRQAVSKWERGEASPDTDNLIALSEVYGVSLDELIKGKTAAEQPVDDTSEDRVNVSFINGIDVVDGKSGDKVHVGWNGVRVESGVNEVRVDKHGVFIKDDKGNTVKKDGHIFFGKSNVKSKIHYYLQHFPYPVLTVIAYLLFGCFDIVGGWSAGWLVFLTIPLYYTLISAIFNRNASNFAYPVFALLIYLFTGLEFGIWHPTWILFLTVPVFYFICEFSKKVINHIN